MASLAGGVRVAVLALATSWTALAAAQAPPSPDPALPGAQDSNATLTDAIALRREGATYVDRGHYTDAFKVQVRAVDISVRVLGRSDPEVGRALNEVARTLNANRDPDNALKIAEGAQRVLEPALGRGDLDFADSQCQIGDALTQKAEYARAEPFLASCASIRERRLAADDVRVARELFSRGVLYAEIGDNAYAEPLFDRALRIFEARFGPDHRETAMTCTRLAWIYIESNDRERARALFKRALLSYRTAFDGNNPDVAYAATGLGEFLNIDRDNVKAEQYWTKARSVYEETLGNDHPDLVPVLIQLGLLAQEKGDFTGDRPLLERALAIQQKAFGPQGPHVAEIFGFLGKHYKENKDITRAEAMYLRALQVPPNRSKTGPVMFESRAGPYGSGDIFSLNGLVTIYEEQGKIDRALDFEERALALEERLISRLFASAAEAQKRKFFGTSVWQTDAMVSLDARTEPPNERMTRLALTTILQRKGRIVDSSADLVAAVRKLGKPEDLPFLERLQRARAELAELTLQRRFNESSVDRAAKLATLQEDARLREQELSRRYASALDSQPPVTVGAVQARLGEHQALLEIALFTRIDPKVPFTLENFQRRFVAYVLKRSGVPQRVDLGLDLPIDQTVQQLRDALSSGGAFADLARHLDEQVMAKIRPLLGGISDVFVSPDGSLATIPFAALVDPEGHFLVETSRFTYLSSGRDLLRLDAEVPAQSAPLVLAAPDYDLRAPPTADERIADIAAASRNGLRAFDFGSVRFHPLPGTADEAAALSQLLGDATVLTGARATKQALTSARGPRILHIATHGFFLEHAHEQDQSSGDPARRNVVLAPAKTSVDLPSDPLLRAGLALAGANYREEGSGGVLTALEVSSLDLRGTKLVVLSACETGMLEVKYGDGTYGLRRALTLAGAESQMISLWQVHDQVTKELMTNYYRKLLQGGARSQSLRDTQLELLSRPATAHPFFWASFIVAGDERTLDAQAAPEVGPRFVAPALAVRAVEPTAHGCSCETAGGNAATGASTLCVLLLVTAGVFRRLLSSRQRA